LVCIVVNFLTTKITASIALDNETAAAAAAGVVAAWLLDVQKVSSHLTNFAVTYVVPPYNPA
jgi:hypothetical protein